MIECDPNVFADSLFSEEADDPPSSPEIEAPSGNVLVETSCVDQESSSDEQEDSNEAPLVQVAWEHLHCSLTILNKEVFNDKDKVFQDCPGCESIDNCRYLTLTHMRLADF
ncbi:hypothetical protein GEMRC1_003608 [Eukaryota sp. GEM-RC1]